MTYGPKQVEIVREGKDLFVYTYDLPSVDLANGYLEVEVSLGGNQWLSTGIALSTLEVALENPAESGTPDR